ncbi:8443_t:CDS:1, partial [Racocetra fulgida]
MSNFEEERNKLYEKLQEVPEKFSITTDIWTTDDKSFMAITLHYLDS